MTTFVLGWHRWGVVLVGLGALVVGSVVLFRSPPPAVSPVVPHGPERPVPKVGTPTPATHAPIPVTWPPDLRDLLAGQVQSDTRTRLVRIDAPDQLDAVAALAADVEADDVVRNEALALLDRSEWEGLPELLIQILDRPDETERFRSFAAQALGALAQRAGAPTLVRVRLRSALTDRQLEVRREALDALVAVHDPSAQVILTRGPTDPGAAGMRDLVIRLLYQVDHQSSIPSIRTLANDPDEATRIAAIAALGQWRDEASRPLFQNAAEATSPRLRRAGLLALQMLAGGSASARLPLSSSAAASP